MTAIGIADKATLDLVKTNVDSILEMTSEQQDRYLENFNIFSGYNRSGNKSDGNYNPVVNQALTKVAYQWDEVVIPAGVTITTADLGVVILCNKITISGLLTASGKGAKGGPKRLTNGTGYNGSDGGGYLGGGGGGGSGKNDISGGRGGNGRAAGGSGNILPAYEGLAGENDFNLISDLDAAISKYAGGGGGGPLGQTSTTATSPGGNGGGFVIICAKEVVINSGGAIRADGIAAQGGSGIFYPGGSGGGGAVIIDTLLLTNNGVVSAAGAPGAKNTNQDLRGGAGGDGSVVLIIRG